MFVGIITVQVDFFSDPENFISFYYMVKNLISNGEEQR